MTIEKVLVNTADITKVSYLK